MYPGLQSLCFFVIMDAYYLSTAVAVFVVGIPKRIA